MACTSARNRSLVHVAHEKVEPKKQDEVKPETAGGWLGGENRVTGILAYSQLYKRAQQKLSGLEGEANGNSDVRHVVDGDFL